MDISFVPFNGLEIEKIFYGRHDIQQGDNEKNDNDNWQNCIKQINNQQGVFIKMSLGCLTELMPLRRLAFGRIADSQPGEQN